MNTEQKILNAAKTVFVKKGLNGVRMKDISDEAGINPASLHYYFRSKQKLFERIFEDIFLSISKQLYSGFDKDISIEEKTYKLIDFLTDVFKEHHHMYFFILTEIYQNGENLHNIILKKPILSFSNFIEQFKKKVSEGKINNIDPLQFIVSIPGMCIIPYISQKVIQPVFDKDLSLDYTKFLNERNAFLKMFVKAILVQDS